jgi:dUTP pyrophosphatase
MSTLYLKRLHEDAKVPSFGSDEAIGRDLYAYLPDKQWTIIPPRTHALIKTGIALAIPYGYYGRVAPRSGLAVKYGFDVLAGVIDSDYRGEVGVVVMNNRDENFRIDHGDRIAQLILEKAARFPIHEVSDADWEALSNTARGADGYGSTGV